MSAIRGKDTGPEMRVRRFLHASGLRFRLHARELPGKPDIVFRRKKACVFIHGCFWHGCPKCIDGTRQVKSNKAFWTGKIATNKERDGRHERALVEAGWKVFTLWECEVGDAEKLRRLADTLAGLPSMPPKR